MQEGGFLGVLLGALGTNLLGNMLAGIGIVRAGYGNQVIIRMNLNLMVFIQVTICLMK